MTDEDLDYQVGGGRAEIRLERPTVLNAYTEHTLVKLNHAMEDAIDDDRVYVIVLTGSGRAFCSGRDLNEATPRDTRLAEAERLGKFGAIIRQLYRGPKPTIAAVNGPAIGGGMELALACDFRIIGESAYFRDGHVSAGYTPTSVGTWILPRLIGLARAKHVTLLGDDIDAETAVDWGLAYEVVPDDDLLDRVREVAARLRDLPATATRESKGLFDPAISSFEEHAQATLEARWACQQSPESVTIREAMMEDREPDFDREY